MKISVIMVAYNSSATIRTAIESYLLQDHAKKELIVVDGASTDETCNIVQEYSHEGVKLFSEPDNGIYDAMNKGLALMGGDGFGFLNSDDKYHNESALSHLVSGLEKYDLVSGTLYFVKAHDDKSPSRIWKPTKYSKGAYELGYTLPHPTTYARRSVFEGVGKFNCKYRSAGDYEWLLRALKIHEFSHGTIDEVITDMLIGGESTGGISSIVNNSKEMLAARQDLLGSGFLDKALFLNLITKLKQLRLV